MEQIDKKIDKTEAELKKCSTGMAKVFLADMEKEREKMKMQLHKMIDPRSAARTPAANRLPHYKLRYLYPLTHFFLFSRFMSLLFACHITLKYYYYLHKKIR